MDDVKLAVLQHIKKYGPIDWKDRTTVARLESAMRTANPKWHRQTSERLRQHASNRISNLEANGYLKKNDYGHFDSTPAGKKAEAFSTELQQKRSMLNVKKEGVARADRRLQVANRLGDTKAAKKYEREKKKFEKQVSNHQQDLDSFKSKGKSLKNFADQSLDSEVGKKRGGTNLDKAYGSNPKRSSGNTSLDKAYGSKSAAGDYDYIPMKKDPKTGVMVRTDPLATHDEHPKKKLTAKKLKSFVDQAKKDLGPGASPHVIASNAADIARNKGIGFTNKTRLAVLKQSGVGKRDLYFAEHGEFPEDTAKREAKKKPKSRKKTTKGNQAGRLKRAKAKIKVKEKKAPKNAKTLSKGPKGGLYYMSGGKKVYVGKKAKKKSK